MSTFSKVVGVWGQSPQAGFLRVENTGTVRQPLNSHQPHRQKNYIYSLPNLQKKGKVSMDVLIKKIQENIERYPDFRIINDSGEDNFFTYRTFSDYAQKVAGKLQRMGVGAKDFVTIELPRNKEYIACMYAVWLTGGAFAPLSVTYPKERIAYIRNNCQAKAVIDSDFLRDIENEEKICPNCIPNADDPSLMIYTSGSTGKPKGVLHSHRSIRDSIVRYAEYIADFPCKRVALGSPFTFVASVQGIFVPLYDCTSTYLMPYEAMRDPVLLADFIEQYQIERTFISPKMLKVFQPKGTSLKVVTTGSERVSNIYRKDFTIKVCYGQTESASAVLAFTVDRKYDNTPIGKPLGNIRTYILDENGKEAVEGELCLAGYFADGYFHLPELTAKTFIANPFNERDGFSTLLRTGDIVRQNENGDIVYLNRKDWMVKINGQRVEPGEIETVIKNTDGVFDAVIKDFKNQYGQTYLVAYYVEKQPLDSETIRKSVQNQLPDYMIPSFFVRLDKLPVNANGKLDRNALTPPEIATYKSEYVAPETDWQKILCQAYGKILGVENVGIDDDFFALGGDSIKSAMVVTECQLNILKSADILSAKTPRNIERILLNRETSQKTVVPKTHKPKIYPLTSSERGMYLEQKLDENSTVYNLNISAVISGTDTQTVKNALTAVMQTHEAFCSRYAQQDGIPVRIVTDTVPEIVVETLQSVQNARTRIDNYSTPFNLDDGIPVRPALYEISDGTVVLHMAIHHIAFDGTSAGIFYRELFNALQGKTLPCNETDLSDIYDINLSEQYQDSMHFYKTMFADGIPVNEMPIKGTRPKIHPTADRQTEFMINNTVLLDRTARKFMLSEFELLFSALAMTLGKYTASDDVVLGIPVNMRPNGAENIMMRRFMTASILRSSRSSARR